MRGIRRAAPVRVQSTPQTSAGGNGAGGPHSTVSVRSPTPQSLAWRRSLLAFRSVGRGAVAGLEFLTRESLSIASVGAGLVAGSLVLGLGPVVALSGAAFLVAGFIALPGKLAGECEAMGQAERSALPVPAWASAVPSITVTGAEVAELERQALEFRVTFRRDRLGVNGHAPLMLSLGQLDAVATVSKHRVLTLPRDAGAGDRLLIMGSSWTFAQRAGLMPDAQLVYELEPQFSGAQVRYVARTHVLVRMDAQRLGTADDMLVESDLAHRLGGVPYHYGQPISVGAPWPESVAELH